VTVAISLITRPRPVSELHGLVYGLDPLPRDESAWWSRPAPVAIFSAVLLVVFNILFW
jgi:SSS family solute:Na+ symporter